MSNIVNVSSLFTSIKKSLESPKRESRYRDIIKMDVDKTYVVRLLPNIKDPEKTFLHYFTQGWTSFATGQRIIETSPQSWGQRCPIAEAYFQVQRNGSDADKEKFKKVMRKENWLVNVYVIDDPTTPENNGKVKLLRYGRQLDKIIKDALEGEDAIGSDIFDLSPSGCNLKIKVEKQGDYPNYSASKFTRSCAIEGLNQEKINEIYNSTIDLTTLVTTKSYEELKAVFDQHYFCIAPSKSDAAASEAKSEPAKTAPKKEVEPTPETAKPTPAKAAPKTTKEDDVPYGETDDEVAKLLADLEA